MSTHTCDTSNRLTFTQKNMRRRKRGTSSCPHEFESDAPLWHLVQCAGGCQNVLMPIGASPVWGAELQGSYQMPKRFSSTCANPCAPVNSGRLSVQPSRPVVFQRGSNWGLCLSQNFIAPVSGFSWVLGWFSNSLLIYINSINLAVKGKK